MRDVVLLGLGNEQEEAPKMADHHALRPLERCILRLAPSGIDETEMPAASVGDQSSSDE
jgi:hypothetical protein